MKRNIWVSGLSALLAAAGLLLAAPVDTQAFEIPDGVYVGDYNLGGMTKEEAQQKVTDYVVRMKSQKITMYVEGQAVDTTAEELGFHWNNPDAAEKAASVYKGGNLVRRYLAEQDIAHENVKIPLDTSLDDAKIIAFVNERCGPLTKPAQDATISRVQGSFVVTESAVGKMVDAEATKTILNEALSNLQEPVIIDVTVVDCQPRVTAEALSTIQDVLGTFSTSFSSSGAARSTNLRVGAEKINGRVLMPGETLSGYECMKPFTTDNGYATASAYENGQVVDSIGGGVCQIATTLYNAALNAEVEITQRQNHSMVVGYVKPSQDAAIAGTYKDIKFTNNYSTPIYVEGYTSGKTLTFTIYGKETRPANRTFEFISETLSSNDPGAPKEQFDPTLAPGQRVQVQSAHRGLKSRLWKVVYVDGVEQSREILHTDTYNASKAIVKVGPAAAPAVTPEVQPVPEETQPTPVESQPTEPQPIEGIDGGPGVNTQEAGVVPKASAQSEAPAS